MAYGRSVMQIPTDLVINSAYEELATKIDLFNQSQNAISIRSEMLRGDQFEQSLFAQMSSIGMADRDTTANTSASAVDISTFKETWTKRNVRFGPIPFTLDQFKKTGLSVEGFAIELGRQFAMGRMDKMVKSAIASLVGVLTKSAGTIYDPSATVTVPNIYGALQKFGDSQNKVEFIVIHSFVFNLLQTQLATVATSVNDVFTELVVGGGTIQKLAGKMYYVIDDSSLVDTALTPDGHYTLFLTNGACEVVESEAVDFVFETVTGNENISQQAQGESAYSVNIKNCQFADSGLAGKVTDTNLIDSSLWTDNNTDVRTGPGAVWVSDDS